jgi:hypothetical protein
VIQNEAGDEWMFQGDNTRNEFCEWLFTKEHEGYIVVAHNFLGYDGYFNQQYLHENGVIPEVIMRGAKILTLYVPMLKIKLIDSFSFIPMKPADFPKTFGLNELAKGYFPHLFNRKENQNYVGPSPISILPIISKIFERSVFNQLYEFLNENSLLSKYQSGFRPKNSTLTALVQMCDAWYASMDNGDLNGVVFLDIRKAFDSINHYNILLQKMKDQFGVSNIELKWFD